MEDSSGSKIIDKDRISFIKKHERALSFTAFVLGFIWDGITLKYVSLSEAGLILGVYLILIAISIIFYNYLKSKVVLNFVKEKVAIFLPYFIQFLFGTLFNAAFLFYFESADIHISWIFLVFVAFILFANEIFRKSHSFLYFQLLMFFIASFLYFVFVIPIFSGKVSVEIFLLSGVTSLVVNFLLMFLLSVFAKERFLHRHILITFIILCLYCIFNFLYFSNIIPPIPLSLKNGEVLNYIEKEGNRYLVLYERDKKSFFNLNNKISVDKNGSVYVFTSIFAPANMSTPIYHDWWYFEESSSKWKLLNSVKFPVFGGREDGYRGYSLINHIKQGKWRVYVRTENGGRLGRISFNVEYAKEHINLEQDYR